MAVPKFITTAEAARLAGVTIQTMRGYIRAGELEAKRQPFKRGAGYLIKRSDFEQWYQGKQIA